MPRRMSPLEPMKIKVPDEKGGWKWINAPTQRPISLYQIKKERPKNEKH